VDESAAVQSLISDLEAFFNSSKVCLSTATFDSFIVVTDEMAKQMERPFQNQSSIGYGEIMLQCHLIACTR
jgi:hypothetical protein